MCSLVEYASSEWWNSILYTHRRLLLTQTSGVLDQHGISHGLRASGHRPALLRPVQLAMVQSELAAVLKKQSRPLHHAQLVLTDELHAIGGETIPTLHRQHLESGAAIVGVTATPIDLQGEWDELIVACTTSEGRACGALVPADVYCPDEPDMRHIKKYRIGDDLTDKENAKVMMRPGVFGRVFTHYKKLNPQSKPTILFAPDVAGSIFFAEQFQKNGVRAAHIDAKQLWVQGEWLNSTDENRAELLRRFGTGEIQVLTNRFVLREGIDLPFVAHAIFACVVGSLRSWLQMVGRVIRAHPSTPSVCVQDHGANLRRHCHPDEDHEWELGMSGHKITGMRQEHMRERPEMEPIVCPNCGLARASGAACPKCGYQAHKRSRLVVQVSGELRRVEGPATKPRRTATKPDTLELWTRMYHRAKSRKWNATFNQAEAMFFVENGYYPPRTMPRFPYELGDMFEKVAAVPLERLR